MTEKPLVKVEASLTFKKNIKTLGKKYRSIRQDRDGDLSINLST